MSSLVTPRRYRTAADVCEADGCALPALWRRLCQRHYRQFLASRDLACTVDGCDQARYCRGLCTTHYERQRIKGDVGGAERLHGPWGDGHVNRNGYLSFKRPGHPLANTQGRLDEHRRVLYDAIGPGTHQCNWCGTDVSWDKDQGTEKLVVDHVDESTLNNDRANLVPACIDCNTHRGKP